MKILSPVDHGGLVGFDRHPITNPMLGPYFEKLIVLTAGSGTKTMDLSSANVFTVDAQGNAITLAFSNVPAARSGSRLVSATIGIYNPGTITWPTGINWGAAGAPTLSTGTKFNWISFWSHDGGTTWFAAASWLG